MTFSKILATALATLLVATSSLRAADQPNSTEYSNESTQRHFNIGYGFYLNALGAINTVPNDGFKTAQGFTAEYGFALFVPFNDKGNYGFGIDIGAASISYDTKQLRTDSSSLIHHEDYSITSIFPHFYFSGFVIGVQAGLSPSGTLTIVDPKGGSSNVAPTDLKPFIMPRLGMELPLAESTWGRFNFNLQAAYAAMGIYSKVDHYPFYKQSPVDQNAVAPVPVTLSLGVSFIFKVPIYY